MTIIVQHTQAVYIGQITEPVFKRIKEAGVAGFTFNDAKSELDAFEQNFMAICAAPNPATSPKIPVWRVFTPYAAEGPFRGYLMHPYASETAFPPTKKMFRSEREAALECCDVHIDDRGVVKAVAIDANLMALVHNDKKSMTMQIISSDKNLMAKPFLSAGAKSPFTLDIKDIKTQTAYIQAARKQAGANVVRLLQQPPYFPANPR